MRFHECYVEVAQPNWRTRFGDHQPGLVKAVATADIRRGLAADQLRAGAVCDERGIQGVVEVRVHRYDRREAFDPDPRETPVDPGRRRRHFAEPDPGQAWPGEEAVGHQCRGAVVDQQCRHPQPRHGQRRVGIGGRHGEAVCVPR